MKLQVTNDSNGLFSRENKISHHRSSAALFNFYLPNTIPRKSDSAVSVQQLEMKCLNRCVSHLLCGFCHFYTHSAAGGYPFYLSLMLPVGW